MMQETHLNSEQLENLMCAAPDATLKLHVDNCTECAAELASLRTVLGDFRTAATESARYHRAVAAVSAPRSRKVPAAAWGLAMAALVAAVAVPFSVHHGGTTTGAQVQTVADVQPDAARPGAAQLSDEALLSGVQDDLSASVPEPLAPLSSSNTTTNNSTTTR